MKMMKTKVIVAADGGSINKGMRLQEIMSQPMGSFVVGTTQMLGLHHL